MARTTDRAEDAYSERNIATERTPAGVRQDPITDPETGAPTPPPHDTPSAAAADKYDDNPEPDPATLDDEDLSGLDLKPGSVRLIPLPRKQDGSINLLGMDVEIMAEETDYGDVVKCRVQGDPKDVARLAMRSRNYFAKSWNQHLHASGSVTN
jgi:hypothetical protein